ncbi:hypothetical protein HPB50_005504 [Hyalomma asiaticum]|uniref:Uncharacterized protein n=1 Tax=Hyalomma asiaticum TaxID=266040 RepID=A0ACB7T8K6_HYAAI|nr:hypothetical protein HPB50_005504 [Hyalomma asiaticum]
MPETWGERLLTTLFEVSSSKESPKSLKPAETEAEEAKVEPRESDDDVVCLDDSNDSDISIVKVVPAKVPKLNPSITIMPATSPKKSLFPEKRRHSGDDLTFPKYVAGQPLLLKRPPRHLLPQNVYPSREWYEVDPTRWCQEETVRDKQRNRGWYGERLSSNSSERNNSGRRNPAMPDLRPDLQCHGNGQSWQAPDMSSWHNTNNSAQTTLEQRRDSRTWSNNFGSSGYSTGQSRGFSQTSTLLTCLTGNHAGREGEVAVHHKPGASPTPEERQAWKEHRYRYLGGRASLGAPCLHRRFTTSHHRHRCFQTGHPEIHRKGTHRSSGNQYGYFTEGYVSEASQRNQEPRRFGSDTSLNSGPGRPDRPNRPNQASYRRTVHRNDRSPRRNWQRAPHRPSHWRAGAPSGPDEDEYPSALPPFTAEATSWSELKSGLAQTERSEALLGGEGSILWKSSIEPLVMPTQELSMPGIVSQLDILQVVDVVNSSGESSSSTPDSSASITPDLDVYLPGTAYSKRNPGTPECRVCVIRWEDGPAEVHDLKARQATVSDSAPLVFAAVDQGQVHLYGFDVMEVPRFFPTP